MKNIINSFLSLFLVCASAHVSHAQITNEKHIPKLEIKKGKTEYFQNARRDSTLRLTIDTLIMANKSNLRFTNLKDVELVVNHAQIGNRALISGNGAKNNGSNMDIEMKIEKMGSLYVIASGRNAMNGTRTFPNGDGGNITFKYLNTGIAPQSKDKKAKNFILLEAGGGGKIVNPQTDIPIILDRIKSGAPSRMGGMPQGQVYSGSQGEDGKVVLEAYE